MYICSILNVLGIDQDIITIIYADDQGTIAMVNVGRLTKYTKHIDTRHFAQ